MKVKYRIIAVISAMNPVTHEFQDYRKIIKAGFTTEQAAEEWNAKHGNPGYIIEPY